MSIKMLFYVASAMLNCLQACQLTPPLAPTLRASPAPEAVCHRLRARAPGSSTQPASACRMCCMPTACCPPPSALSICTRRALAHSQTQMSSARSKMLLCTPCCFLTKTGACLLHVICPLSCPHSVNSCMLPTNILMLACTMCLTEQSWFPYTTAISQRANWIWQSKLHSDAYMAAIVCGCLFHVDIYGLRCCICHVHVLPICHSEGVTHAHGLMRTSPRCDMLLHA